MRIKRKNGLKIAAITIALLLCLALAVGITGAWYQAKRQATGTLSMDQGIIIDYKGFGQTPNEGIWSRDTTTKFLLFSETNAQPGEQIAVNAAGIRANEKSVNFYARVKLSYKFYNNGTEVTTLPNASDLITTSANFFGTNWVDGGGADGYYYYATGSTLNKFEKGAAATTPFVNLFATDAKFIIEGEGFVGADNNGASGGFVVDETTSINKIVVNLVLETLQGEADPATEGWSWKTKIPVIEEFSENKLLNANGDVLDPKITDLVENTTYKVVDEEGNGYQFTYVLNEESKTATITGYVGSPTTLNIPKIIQVKQQDYTVTSIGYAAFEKSPLRSITMPDSLIGIGSFAFRNCSGLEEIEVESGNTKYHSSGNCLIETASKTLITGCKNSVIPTDGSVASISSDAFSSCNGLTSITIPDSVISIGVEAFSGCSGLTSITIPNSVVSIGVDAFRNCSGLEEIEVESGNTKYHSSGNCLIETASKTLITGCKNSVIPTDGSVASIRSYAFSGCSGLTSITIPSSVTIIGSYAFLGCTSLTTVTFGENSKLSSIGELAFQKCKSLTTVTFGENSKLTSIGKYAFSYCDALTSITIPESVTSIGFCTFTDCNGLKTVIIDSATIAALGSSNNYLLYYATKVYVKSDITTVGSYITGSFEKAATSDKDGYDMYTKKA